MMLLSFLYTKKKIGGAGNGVLLGLIFFFFALTRVFSSLDCSLSSELKFLPCQVFSHHHIS